MSRMIPITKSIAFYLIIILSFSFSEAKAVSNDLRLETLDKQLEMLLPGVSMQEQSARSYAKERMQTFFEHLEKRNLRRKKRSKAIHIIKEEVETVFFKNFSNFSQMSVLFKQGIYDQSTASALYTIVFDYFEIPYTIELRASDVSVIVEQEDFDEMLTIPNSSRLNDAKYRAFQMSYIGLLRTVGFVSKEEWGNKPEVVFNNYYLGENEEVTLAKMASFLHYRQSLNAYQQKSWVVCLDEINKAQNRSSLPLYAVLERVVWLQLANEDKESKQSLHYLIELWQAYPNSIWQTELIQRFHSEATHLKPATQWAIDSTYAVFDKQFEGYPDAKEQLKAMNYLVQARFFAEKGQTVEVLNFMDSLYVFYPNDKGVQEVLAAMLVWSLKKERNYDKGIQRINYYEKKYPFLKSNATFLDQHLFYLAERIRDRFDEGDAALGNIYIKEFEMILNQHNPTNRHDSWVSTAYISASNYFFRENQYRSAYDLILKALERSPEDAYLQHRKDLLYRYLR